MSVTIHTVGELTQTGNTIFVYGQSGAGKTYAMSTLPNPIVLSTEFGLLSLKKNRPDINCIVIHNFTELADAFTWVADSPEAQQYSHVCLDSFSDISEVVLASNKTNNKDMRKAYMEMGDTVTSMCRMIRALPCNTYVTAKEGMVTEGDGFVRMGPVFPGKALSPQIPFYFDEVFQLYVMTNQESGLKERWFRTDSDPQFIAKDRSGVLDPWEPADLNAIFNKIGA